MKTMRNIAASLVVVALCLCLITPAYAVPLAVGSGTGQVKVTAMGEVQKIGRMRMAQVTVTFGNGALTYPATGVPLPTATSLGMTRVVSFVQVMPPPGNGYLYKYDATNHSLRLWQATAVGTISSDTAGTPAGTVSAPLMNIAGDTAGTVPIGISSDADGASLSKTSAGNKTGITGIQAPTFTGSALAGHTHTLTGTAGALTEVTTAHTPAATTVIMQVWGY